MAEKLLYAKLRYMRAKLGITQEQLSKLIGCGVPNYANKERGRVPWSFAECKAIQEFINKKLKERGEDEVILEELFFADVVAKMQRKKKATAV